MRVLICGSRNWNRPTLIGRRLAKLPPDTEVIHGGAKGADLYAHLYANALGLAVRVFPADWHRYGKRAGIIRNIQMLDTKPDLVIAFWDRVSAGTSHTVSQARKRGIPVEIHK